MLDTVYEMFQILTKRHPILSRYKNIGCLCTSVIPRLHDTTGCQSGCTTGCTTRYDNLFDNRVERTATVRSTGCQTELYNRFDNTLYTRYIRLSNRFDNRLYRVYKHLTGCHSRLYRVNRALSLNKISPVRD